MTTFTLEGLFQGAFTQITWTDGKLSGDPGLVALTEQFIAGFDGKLVGSSSGIMASQDHIDNPYVACELMQMLLQHPTLVAGALPEIPEPPEGGIA